MADSLPTALPATWADVTLREFAALDLIRDPKGIDRLNRYWDNLHADPANVFRGPTADRLTPSGVAWWEELHARFHADANNATLARELAQAALKSLGFLCIMNASKLARA